MPWSWTNTLRSIIITDVYQAMQVPFQAHLYPAEVLKLPHPVNMTRQRLSALDSGWFVTYKADGVRYLWIRAVYLGRMFDITINRRCEMNILQNKASDVESGIYFALDCELVDSQFTCHDVLIFDRVPVLFRAFSKRIKILYMLRDKDDMPQPKSFYPCSQIQMVPDAGDGYIFVHCTDKFQTGKSETMIKWKPLHDISIDMLVDNQLRPMMSSAQGHIPFTDTIGKGQLTLDECKDQIVEFKYKDSAWVPVKVRDDKNTANDAYVIKETVLSAHEPILYDQLLSKCTSIM